MENKTKTKDVMIGGTTIHRGIPDGVNKLSDGISKTLSPIKPFKSLVLQQTTPRRETFGSEYDLKTVQKVIDVESYFARSVVKKRSVVMKEGYRFKSRDPKSLEAILLRIMEMEHVTDVSFEMILTEIVNEILIFNNCFILKIRDQKATSAKGAKMADGKQREPIAGLRILPTPYVEKEIDKRGKIVKYKVVRGGEEIEKHNPEDVIHIYRNKKHGALYGTPEVIPVIDDIMALRRIEENVETIVYRHAVPFMVVTVGTEKFPARVTTATGQSELDLARDVISGTEPGYALIFPERYKVEIVGSKTAAIDVGPYLTHFKKRVFAGLGMSAFDFGETDSANRGSSEGLSLDFIDYCKDIQRTIAMFLNMLLREMMVEMFGVEKAYDVESEIKFVFNEIDPTRRSRDENATVQLFVSNLIDQKEGRKRLEIDGDPDENLLYSVMVQEAIMSGDGVSNEAGNDVKPTNQHTNAKSIKSGNYKIKASNRLSRSVVKDKSKMLEITKEIQKLYTIKPEDIKTIMDIAYKVSEGRNNFVADIIFDNTVKEMLSVWEKKVD